MSSSAFIETSTPVEILLGKYRLLWSYEHDRWQHRLQTPNAAVSDDITWSDLLIPAPSDSPTLVLQDLFVEHRTNGEVEIQGMGQSGKAIHSAAITCSPAAQTITFDLATRFRNPSEVTPLLIAYTRLSPCATLAQPLLSPLPASSFQSVRTTPPSDSPEKTSRIDWDSPAQTLTLRWGYLIRIPSPAAS